MTPAEIADSALEVATDAILRRARLLDSQDPEVAEALRNIVLRLDASMTAAPSRHKKSRALAQAREDWL